jgi:hypothetical protein
MLLGNLCKAVSQFGVLDRLLAENLEETRYRLHREAAVGGNDGAQFD